MYYELDYDTGQLRKLTDAEKLKHDAIGRIYKDPRRNLGKATIKSKGNNNWTVLEVSTVFLVMDHNSDRYYESHTGTVYRPTVFELLIFKGSKILLQWRSTSMYDIIKKHKIAVDYLEKVY